MYNINEETFEELRKLDSARKNKFNDTLESLLSSDEHFKSLYIEKRKNIGLYLRTGNPQYNTNINNIIKELANYAKSKGYDIQSTTYTPICSECEDLGTKKDGSLCNCFYTLRKNLTLKRYPMLNVPNLDRIDTSIYDSKNLINNKKIIKLMDYFLNDNKYSLIVLYGKPGVGKSYLAYSAGNTYASNNIVSVIPAIDTTSLFKFDFKTNRIYGEEELYFPDLLIIDDLGSEHYFDNINDTGLLQLLEIRKNNKTIITSNLNPAQIEARYHQRIYSRLTSSSCLIIEMSSDKDLRSKK